MLTRQGLNTDYQLRKALLRAVPEAAPGGKVNRVFAPIKAMADHQAAVVMAMSDLARDLAGFRPRSRTPEG